MNFGFTEEQEFLRSTVREFLEKECPMSMVRELISERMTSGAQRRSLGSLGPSQDFCPAECCLSGRPGQPKSALCGAAEA